MTLKEFKSRLAQNALVRHLRSTKRGEVNEVYLVSKVQGNGVYLDPVEKPRPDGRAYWMPFPLKNDLTADEQGFVIRSESGETVYQWLDLRSLVDEIQTHYDRKEWDDVTRKADLYFRLRGKLPQPKGIPCHDGVPFDGDHIVGNRNRYARLERDGIQATHGE
jgi:hypothetical protein